MLSRVLGKPCESGPCRQGFLSIPAPPSHRSQTWPCVCGWCWWEKVSCPDPAARDLCVYSGMRGLPDLLSVAQGFVYTGRKRNGERTQFCVSFPGAAKGLLQACRGYKPVVLRGSFQASPPKSLGRGHRKEWTSLLVQRNFPVSQRSPILNWSVSPNALKLTALFLPMVWQPPLSTSSAKLGIDRESHLSQRGFLLFGIQLT